MLGWALLAVVALGAPLCIAETVLRLLGRGPVEIRALHPDEPVLNEPHPERGWRALPGSHVIPPYAPGSPPIRMRILADGSRATGEGAAVGPGLALLGGSFVQGWAVSDRDTFAWRIQQRFPQWRVRNFGTAAYGTYQSLLILEDLLARQDRPRVVLYGFIHEHERRNVAEPVWLRLLSLYARKGVLALPYCTRTADGSLVRHPPESFPHWPLREQLASVALLEADFAALRARGRAAQAREVTERLLLALRDASAQHGARFAVLFLHVRRDVKSAYARFLADHDVAFVDCHLALGRELRVPGEGHPNARAHALWAECIGRALEDRILPAP